MECKVLQEEEPEALRRDLIETLWNVKQIMANFNVWNTNDLIETLWNVKINQKVGLLTTVTI